MLKKKNKIVSELMSWGRAIVFGISITLFISIFIFQPFKVEGSSMEPTFNGADPFDKNKVGDHVMVYKSSYLLGSEPKFGDLVIIDSRVNRNRTFKDELLENPIVELFRNGEKGNKWIKRVIGEAGDTLEIKNGKVYRNGKLLTEDYIKEEMNVYDDVTFVVPNDHVFVMGDNRNHSGDSREIGPVPFDNVIGKVVARFYPFSKMSHFE
ncbi:signal peptidase I [Bacillus sp. CGMCC 1.16607]|uniref:signal peptidase I n=1 Tax=Bacillus sp. CGMCC 1.16607 TaxID=3351842 RepID=UPI00363FF6CF